MYTQRERSRRGDGVEILHGVAAASECEAWAKVPALCAELGGVLTALCRIGYLLLS